VNRCKKLGIKYEELSKFGEVECKQMPKFNIVTIAGCVVLDQLWLYKVFSSTKKESYSLDFIANDEVGEGKLGKSSAFYSEFFENPVAAIKYNIQDVILLDMLNNKLSHISFQIMRARLCKTSFESARGSMGLIDSLLTYSLKERGIVCKNSVSSDEEVDFEGAFVLEPMTGLHKFIVDFDFAALYPSIIMTYNIGINTFVMKFEDQSLGYIYSYEREKLPESFVIIQDPLTSATKRTMKKEELLEIIEKNKYICTINGCFFKSHGEERSYYLDMLEELLGMRKKYKKEMFEAASRGDLKGSEVLDEKQLALKSLTNSVYGVFGTQYFRFFNVDLAKSITYSGQEVVKNSIIEAESVVVGMKDNNTDRPHKLNDKEIFGKLDREIQNVITGDTDSIFVTYQNILGKKKYKDVVHDIEKMNSYIENFLNTTVVGEIIDRHNVEKKNSRLEIKNELIIKNGLFLSKKHYTVYVLMREHKAVNEVKNVGIEIRRSDYPAFTKKKLMELVDLVLKSDNTTLVDILNYVKDTEDVFITMINNGDKTIARPVSFTKKEVDYKKITFGVNGMKNWNILEKKVFDQGSRGYHFKIKGIDIDKAPEKVLESYYKNFVGMGKILKDIVIPETEPMLPEYYIRDTKDMLRFSWIDRYSLLLGPLLKIESAKKNIGF
jgi:DNA polymerase elongation subunit (family B)